MSGIIHPCRRRQWQTTPEHQILPRKSFRITWILTRLEGLLLLLQSRKTGNWWHLNSWRDCYHITVHICGLQYIKTGNYSMHLFIMLHNHSNIWMWPVSHSDTHWVTSWVKTQKGMKDKIKTLCLCQEFNPAHSPATELTEISAMSHHKTKTESAKKERLLL